MLNSLIIKNYLLIANLTINFNDGLTVLTGETGTGKSILLDALALVIGARADKSTIRYGAKQSIITAVFIPNPLHEVFKVLAEHALIEDTSDEEITLRRVIQNDGKSRAFVNDIPVTNTLLKTIGNALIEIHGQNAEQGFLSPRTHLLLLDLYADLKPQANSISNLFKKIKEERNNLHNQQQKIKAEESLIDYYKQIIDDISDINPKNNELSQLIEQRSNLMVGEKSRLLLNDLFNFWHSSNYSDMLGKFSRRLEKLALENKKIKAISSQLEELILLNENVEENIKSLIDHSGKEENTLEQVEERLHELKSVSRKYNYDTDQLNDLLHTTKEKYSQIRQQHTNHSQHQQRISELVNQYNALSENLSQQRKKASVALTKSVNEEIKSLKLGIASFKVEITDIESGTFGKDKVIFTISTNKNMPSGPLQQIASGGELSRFVLALKAALAKQEAKTVIIFDEVDAGIGGSVAAAVGERLFKLGLENQILVITHSPQVASFAKHHYVIRKSNQDNIATSSLKKLSQSEKTEEIARMLSGEKITQAARDAAFELLRNATK